MPSDIWVTVTCRYPWTSDKCPICRVVSSVNYVTLILLKYAQGTFCDIPPLPPIWDLPSVNLQHGRLYVLLGRCFTWQVILGIPYLQNGHQVYSHRTWNVFIPAWGLPEGWQELAPAELRKSPAHCLPIPSGPRTHTAPTMGGCTWTLCPCCTPCRHSILPSMQHCQEICTAGQSAAGDKRWNIKF